MAAGHSGLFIETSALDDAVLRIQASEGEAGHRRSFMGWRCCTIRDPFGNLFDLIDANQKGDA